jgi:hypothetical protein
MRLLLPLHSPDVLGIKFCGEFAKSLINEFHRRTEDTVTVNRSPLNGFGADAVFPVGDDEPEEAGDEDCFDGEVEAMEDRFEARVGVPGCT